MELKTWEGQYGRRHAKFSGSTGETRLELFKDQYDSTYRGGSVFLKTTEIDFYHPEQPGDTAMVFVEDLMNALVAVGAIKDYVLGDNRD